jgi:hypothetical protein
MNDHDEELELKALERELEDAFATTRPRHGFEDELWLRMQAQRPAPSKIRDAFAGFFAGIRAVPMVPAAATAAVLVFAVGVGFLAYSGVLQTPHGSAASAPASQQFAGGAGERQLSLGSFGKLPSPVLKPGTADTQVPAPLSNAAAGAQTTYSGPATLTWTGQLKVTIPTAPVFRYREPASSKADEFAAALGAARDGKPAGYLGSYSAGTYTLQVRGTVQSPAQSPMYYIASTPQMAPIAAAGASPADIATFFLAEHSLVPQWPNTVVVQGSGEQVKVLFIRQFDAVGYGPASLLNSGGEPYGLEVDLNGNTITRVAGLLPVNLDAAPYPIISADQAIRAALTSSPNQTSSGNPVPAVKLTKADLVYVLAPAGDHSFYEPAYLFSGTFQMNSTNYIVRVLVPAVDPTHRS